MDDLLRRANANRQHVENSEPENTRAVLADIEACLIINEELTVLVDKEVGAEGREGRC